MSEAQERAWRDLAPRYVVEAPRDAAATSIRPDSAIDPAVVWGRTAPLVVEIGSGQGHAIVHAAGERLVGQLTTAGYQVPAWQFGCKVELLLDDDEDDA